MEYSTKFISATKEFSTYEKSVPSPYFRKNFNIDFIPEKVEMLICGLGFYEVFLNGERLTKGCLSPYISNPDHLLYYDRYDITEKIRQGKNTLGFILGNGMQNCYGGQVWDFEQAEYRSAPKLALFFEAQGNGKAVCFEADETFLTFPSPTYADDLRVGECYNANKEIPDWNLPEFDDSKWQHAIKAETPCGEPVEGNHKLIKKIREIKPVKITSDTELLWSKVRNNLPKVELPEDEKTNKGYLYDFGENITGVPHLKIKGKKGQKIVMTFAEALWENKADMSNIGEFQPLNMTQRDIYICKGDGVEEWEPMFTYHGFQYCLVSGIDESQATNDLITYVVIHADLKPMGGFSCSDELTNKLQEATVRSDLANLFYFPTDCPHREKNGWTGDANLSTEQFLMNLDVDDTLQEWLRNVRKAQKHDGSLPGIVPTAGWGYEWGNGPAWDAVLVEIPYRLWQYRGNKKVLEENAEAIIKYIKYLITSVDEKGLMHIGLGDWLPVDNKTPIPLEITDTLISMDIAKKSAEIFDILNQDNNRNTALDFYNRLRNSFRENLIENSLEVVSHHQSAQAMALYYGAFEENEKEQAFSHLLRYIHEANDSMTVGILGARTIFHVLSEFGYEELALHMIAKPDYPSFGSWITEYNANTLFEIITHNPPNGFSHNHHFFGDFSAWFIKNLAGIIPNKDATDVNSIEISPAFVKNLDYAEGWYNTLKGKVSVKWSRVDNSVKLQTDVPDGLTGKITLRHGYHFESGNNTSPLKSGTFVVTKQ